MDKVLLNELLTNQDYQDVKELNCIQLNRSHTECGGARRSQNQLYLNGH